MRANNEQTRVRNLLLLTEKIIYLLKPMVSCKVHKQDSHSHCKKTL